MTVTATAEAERTLGIDDIEYIAWHYWAEPTAARMEELLNAVEAYAQQRNRTELPADILPPEPPEIPELVPVSQGQVTKKCSRCKNTLPLTGEHFNRDRSMSSGFSSKCKQCTKKYRHELRSGFNKAVKD